MAKIMANRRHWLPILLIAGVGCSGGGPVAVRGTVKLDGQPLAGASVLFIAQSPGGKDATGFTDANGMFRLSTYQPSDGALPGKYKVIVQVPAAADDSAPVAASQEEAQQAPARPGKPKRPATLIPARYSRPDQTVLVQDVPARGDVVFELQSSE